MVMKKGSVILPMHKTDVKEVLARLYNQECTESGSPGGKPEN